MVKMNDLEKWVKTLSNLIEKPMYELIHGNLQQSLPIRGSDSEARYRNCTYLEFVGRTLCGLAPAIEIGYSEKLGFSVSDLHKALGELCDEKSSSFLNFSKGTQPLVDSAFLALAFIRAPYKLWAEMPDDIKFNVIKALKSSRKIKPHFNNWLLFSGVIEAFFFSIGEDFDAMRVDYALRQHEQWYLGDGVYGDGALYRSDYYNSFVILPLLLQITSSFKGLNKDWDVLGAKILQRAKRYAVQQERMIGPDGTFPPIGRSICYRGAAFHLLAQLALMGELPSSLKPGQVRDALWAVIEKTLVGQANYDENGWLHIGLNGLQPNLGEDYISTGSLYLTSVIFLPLGLPHDSDFWKAPPQPWTQRKLWWFAESLDADRAL